MVYMFQNMYKLEYLDLSSFVPSKVTDVNRMMNQCKLLKTLKISNFDASNIINLSYFCYFCQSLTSIDLSNFKTKKVQNLSYMFAEIIKMKFLDF